jgi:hypothetical protein
VAQRIVQTGAARGARGGKSGQSNYFVGYKKHTLCGLVRRSDKFCPLPLVSLARPANLSDVEMLLPLLEQARRALAGRWPLGLVIADRGYIGGEPLVWEAYDPADGGVLIYRGRPDLCAACPLAGTCTRQFEYGSGRHETFWGMVPSHSRLARELRRRFRPRVEPGFNLAKNKYRLKGFFLNSLELTQALCVMSDVLEVLEFLAQERPRQGRQMKKTLQCDLQAPELWD